VSETSYAKPLPAPSPESRPFWEAARKHELRLQRCESCHAYWFPPSTVCQECLSEDWTWERVSGQGEVFSFVVMHRAYVPGFKPELPYNVALIALREGPHFLSNVVGCANEDIYVGMPVEVVFDDVTEEVTLPKFRPRAK
jgi:uncharacterized OB-fold protein